MQYRRPFLLALAFAASSSAFATIDPAARLSLVRSAAEKAQLAEVGLDHRDLYGVIHAESGWVPRNGMGKNGVVSVGVAQFEPATARAVGLRNPNDTVQSVEAAAVLLREAAQWSARKLQGLDLTPAEWAMRLREGVSIYYNLSTRSRSAWNGRNSFQFPVETQRHIRNARHGALIARRIEGEAPAVEVRAARFDHAPLVPVERSRSEAHSAGRVTIAGIPHARPIPGGLQLPQGTIRWSRPPGT